MSKIKTLLLISFLTILVTGAWFYTQKEVQAEKAIRSYLASKGITDVTISIAECGLYVCRIPELKIGTDIEIKNLWAQYDPQSIVNQKITFLNVDSISLHVRETNEGIALGGLEKLLNDAAPNPQPTQPKLQMPVKALLIGSLRLQYSKDDTTHTVEVGQVTLQDHSTPEVPSYTIMAKAVNYLHDPAFMVPLDVQLYMSQSLDLIKAWGSLANESVSLHLPYEFSYHTQSNSLQGNLSLEPFVFSTGSIQPDQIVPIIGNKLQQVEGAVSGKLDIAYKDGVFSSPLELSINAFSATVAGVRVEEADTELTFSSLMPLLTKGKQTIMVNRLIAGVPLEKGQIQFTLRPNDQVILYPMKWNWAGGSLVTDQMQTNWKKPALKEIKLHVRQIDLQSLMSLMLKQDFAAEGVLDGTIPVRFADGRVLLENATLAAINEGKLRYTTADPSLVASGGASTELLAKALEDFHFKVLSMRVNSEPDGKSLIALQIKGANPALYDGKPIELNVNLRGNLEEIIKHSMDVYALPSQLEKQLTE